MTEFRVIEGREHHCGQIVRRLRENQREILIGLGVNAHREIRTNFDVSAFRRAWLVDGRLAALFGVTGPLLTAQGYCWLALSDIATKYPIEVVKETKRQFAIIMQTKREIYTTLLPEDRAAIRFADVLGFEQAHAAPVPYGNGRVIAVRYRGPSIAAAA